MSRNPVPQALVTKASMPGMRYVRFWGDEVPNDIAAQAKRRMPGLRRLAESPPDADGRPVVNYLALSGGGQDGAFGAGFLVGWTQSRERPRFEVVTGVSAGALIAPFAFLGRGYDNQLRAMWTRYGTDDLVVKQPLVGIFGGPALADTKPLADLIARHIDRRFLAAVASEYRKGRLLLVGTTNLDAQRPVVWNMGEIAASGHPEALDLFRQVLLASAAVPGAFSPVHITVEVNGRKHEEMHVDGGATRELFIAPIQLSLRELDALHSTSPTHRIFVIWNAKLGPEWRSTEASTLAVATRSLSTLLKSQGAGDLLRLHLMAKRDGADFNLASIPPRFAAVSKELFDREYMRALFEIGVAQGRARHRWLKAPPEFATAPTSD